MSDTQPQLTRRQALFAATVPLQGSILDTIFGDDDVEVRDPYGADPLRIEDGDKHVMDGPMAMRFGSGLSASQDGSTTVVDATGGGSSTSSGPSVYDYVVTGSDDVVDIVNNQLSSGETVLIDGTHTLSTTLSPPDNTRLDIIGTLKLADGANTNILERTDAPQSVVVRGFGMGVIDGNKANQGGSASTHGYECLRFEHTDTSGSPPTRECQVHGLEIKNVYRGAAIVFGTASSTPSERCQATNNYIHDCGTGSTNCDAIFSGCRQGVIANNVTKNVTDTHIAQDNAQRQVVVGNTCYNTSTFNSNVGDASQGITLYGPDIEHTSIVAGNVLEGVGASNGAITGFSNNPSASRAVVVGNYVRGATGASIRLTSNCHWSVVGNFTVGGNAETLVHNGGAPSIQGNAFGGSTSNGLVQLSTDAVFTGNRCAQQGSGDAIVLQSSATDCIVTSNRVTNAGSSSAGLAYGGSNDRNIVSLNNYNGLGSSGTPGANGIKTNNIE